MDLRAKFPELEAARTQGVKVTGRVMGSSGQNFRVKIGDAEAICPAAKMETGFIHNKSAYVGKDFEFLVVELKKRIVLSRVAILKREAHAALDTIATHWNTEKDRVYRGRVVRIVEFGAFVDLGGIEGLMHISELSHQRIDRVEDAVRVGDTIAVKIIKIEGQGKKRRVSLSHKATLKSPWDDVEQRFEKGGRYPGVVKSNAEFGSFVDMGEGIIGLMRPEDYSWDAAQTDPPAVGSNIDVWVSGFDHKRKRLRVSAKDPELDPWKKVDQLSRGEKIHGRVLRLTQAGATIEILGGLEGFLPVRTLTKAFHQSYRKHAEPGKEIEVSVVHIDRAGRAIKLSLPQLQDDSGDRSDLAAYQAAQKKKQAAADEGLGALGLKLREQLQKKS